MKCENVSALAFYNANAQKIEVPDDEPISLNMGKAIQSTKLHSSFENACRCEELKTLVQKLHSVNKVILCEEDCTICAIPKAVWYFSLKEYFSDFVILLAMDAVYTNCNTPKMHKFEEYAPILFLPGIGKLRRSQPLSQPEFKHIWENIFDLNLDLKENAPFKWVYTLIKNWCAGIKLSMNLKNNSLEEIWNDITSRFKSSKTLWRNYIPLWDHTSIFYPSFDSNIVGKIRQAYSSAQQPQSSCDGHTNTIAYLALVGSLVHGGKNTTALTRASLKTKTMECGYFDVEEFIRDVKNSPVSHNIRKTIHAAISYVCNMGFIIPIENTSLVHKKGNWVSENLELNLKGFVLIEKQNSDGDHCVLFAVSGNPGNSRSANATKPPLEEWASLAISSVFFPQHTPIKIGILNIAESYIAWWPISLQENVTKICTDAVFFECIRC